MKQISRSALVVFVFLAFNCSSWCATVNTKDGSSITGEVSGRVAFKSEYAEIEKDAKQYGVYFYMIANGSSISEVTSEGVKLAGGEATLLLVSWDLAGKSKGPSDTEVLAAEHKEMGSNPIAFGWLEKSGADVCRMTMGISEPKTVTEVFGAIKGWMRGSSPAFDASPKLGTIIGEWKAGKLIPILTIQEPAGLKTLDVTKVVPFS